jgi:hypothetical protein
MASDNTELDNADFDGALQQTSSVVDRTLSNPEMKKELDSADGLLVTGTWDQEEHDKSDSLK